MKSASDLRAGRVLVSTLHSPDGGVPEMVRFATGALRSRGLEPILAYYKPFSIDPNLSVPSYRLLQRRPGVRMATSPDGFVAHEIGAWLPELEFTTYGMNEYWQRAIDSCEMHVAVSGNFLAARPLAAAGVPYLAWLATPWLADREDRVRRYPGARRLLDQAVVRPVSQRLERSILRKGHVVALSEYTRREIDARAGAPVTKAVLPVPVDTDVFRPAPERVRPWTIGFAGRLSDPRKNLDFLLGVVERCRDMGHPAVAVLGGSSEGLSSESVRLARVLGEAERHERLPAPQFARLLQTLDVFLVPSRQEGLCIAALEAMACGCPVVSTRCGGPEEYVKDGKTGFLTGFDPEEAARRVVQIASDRALRERLGGAGRGTVEERYSVSSAERTFLQQLDAVFTATMGGARAPLALAASR